MWGMILLQLFRRAIGTASGKLMLGRLKLTLLTDAARRFDATLYVGDGSNINDDAMAARKKTPITVAETKANGGCATSSVEPGLTGQECRKHVKVGSVVEQYMHGVRMLQQSHAQNKTHSHRRF